MRISLFTLYFKESIHMIQHIGIYVSSIKESAAFYIPALKSIGYDIIIQNDLCVALGKGGVPFFEIYGGKTPTSPIHIAFECASKEEVALFHQTSLLLGATDNGKPDYRHYFPGYYAAFVTDLNGHNLEGLFWDSEKRVK